MVNKQIYCITSWLDTRVFHPTPMGQCCPCCTHHPPCFHFQIKALTRFMALLIAAEEPHGASLGNHGFRREPSCRRQLASVLAGEALRLSICMSQQPGLIPAHVRHQGISQREEIDAGCTIWSWELLRLSKVGDTIHTDWGNSPSGQCAGVMLNISEMQLSYPLASVSSHQNFASLMCPPPPLSLPSPAIPMLTFLFHSTEQHGLWESIVSWGSLVIVLPFPMTPTRSSKRMMALQALPFADKVCSWETACGLLCSCPFPLGSALEVSWPLLAG